MNLEVTQENGFKYVEAGSGPNVVLLHGLFGALSNFLDTLREFHTRFRVMVPILPLYELSTDRTNLDGMVDYLDGLIRHKGLRNLHLLGNSLGGHIGLLYTLKRMSNVKSLVLTGSSGLFEQGMGDGFPRKGDYEYIKKKTEYTFYDPATASKELVDEVYNIVNERNKAIRILYLAKSAIRQNLRRELAKIKIPVKLIWGKQDKITPLFVGEEFNELIPNSSLTVMDRCGHAPMMEKPEEFNKILDDFLTQNVMV